MHSSSSACSYMDLHPHSPQGELGCCPCCDKALLDVLSSATNGAAVGIDGENTGSAESIAEHPLRAVIFQVSHCSQIWASAMQKRVIKWSLEGQISGWSRQTISGLFKKKYLGWIILIKNTFDFFHNCFWEHCWAILLQTASLEYFSLVVKILAKYWKSWLYQLSLAKCSATQIFWLGRTQQNERDFSLETVLFCSRLLTFHACKYHPVPDLHGPNHLYQLSSLWFVHPYPIKCFDLEKAEVTLLKAGSLKKQNFLQYQIFDLL